jgi:hypothetical protein
MKYIYLAQLLGSTLVLILVTIRDTLHIESIQNGTSLNFATGFFSGLRVIAQTIYFLVILFFAMQTKTNPLLMIETQVSADIYNPLNNSTRMSTVNALDDL